MRRLPLVLVSMVAGGSVPLLVLACSSSTATSDRNGGAADAAIRRDGGKVEAASPAPMDAGPPSGFEPSCAQYCALAMTNCEGANAQYESADECLEICARLPLGRAGSMDENSIACRQYYAASPARTDAPRYCAAAGPFGGGICGDRCATFCALVIDVCTSDGNTKPYASYPDCQTACASFAYVAHEADGGGEGPGGPSAGNTLNCRLFHARSAVVDGNGCESVGAQSVACQ